MKKGRYSVMYVIQMPLLASKPLIAPNQRVFHAYRIMNYQLKHEIGQ